MAPPIVVIDRSLVKIPADCPLKAITQYECGLYESEVVCTPFKRLFRVCQEKNRKLPRSYEVTDHSGSRKGSPKFFEITQEVLAQGK